MVKRLLHTLKNRPDTEHEQAVVRVLVGFTATVYVLSMLWRTGEGVDTLRITLLALFFVVAFAIVFWIIIAPGINPYRRGFGCVVDNCGATAMLWLNGDLAAPVFIVYLWVAFGNGFRFGKKYLLFSMALAILGFTSVLVSSNLWQISHSVSLGLLVGLVVLPLYVASLLGRLEKALVKAEAANEAKSNFLATMSHEIRTPLNGLIGLLDLLDITNLQKRQQHYVELMKRSSQWLLNVISDGLDFTKIEAGELIVDSSPMDLEGVIRDLSDVYKEVAASKGITFHDVTSGLKVKHILCDRNRLTQILNNLLGNACKFTQDGSVVFTVASNEQPNGKTHLSFLVEDTGVGISKEDLKYIFSPFKQIQNSSRGIQSGTGLGLAISNRLAELMSGEIRVESNPGKGSQFSLFLETPIAKDYEPLTQSQSLQTIQWKRPPQILLAEDNAINREVAIENLQLLGCNTVSVENGRQAVELSKSQDFDLILMDCQMPEMDGYEATRKIRSLEIGPPVKIIIALTANITEQDRKKCFDAGMDDYMGKPYKIEMLRRLLCKWLDSILAKQVESVSQGRRESTSNHVEKYTESHDRLPVHDLRNILTGVIGGVELAMLSTKDPLRCEHHLQTALFSAQRANAILENL